MRVSALVLVALCAACLCAAEETADTLDMKDLYTGHPEEDGKAEMARMDTNGDGKATIHEVQAFMRKSYYGEGEVEKIHAATGKTNPVEKKNHIDDLVKKDATELIQFMDTDKSGDLSLQEVIDSFKDDEHSMEESEETTNVDVDEPDELEEVDDPDVLT